MRIAIRFVFLWLFNPLVKLMAKLHYPVKERYLEKHTDEIKSLCKPGHIIISKKRLGVSNLLIAGKYKHALIVGRGGNIIEAVSPRVRKTPIEEFCKNTDYACILDPNLLTDEEKMKLVDFVEQQVGISYDYFFQTNDHWYCSELITTGIELIKGTEIWTNRDIFGVKTTVPTDFYDSSKFTVVKEF